MVGSINNGKVYQLGIDLQKKTKFLEKCVEYSNIGLSQLREHREEITRRWERVGLLEGLSGNVKENCAQLFEGQLSWMQNEEVQEENRQQFETIVFPKVRQVGATLLASEIISIQALRVKSLIDIMDELETEHYNNELNDYIG